MATTEAQVKLTKEQMAQIIIDGGRSTAVELMEAAVSTAENPTQMMNQLQVLRAAAIHILGTWMINDVMQTGMTSDQAKALIVASIQSEYELLCTEKPDLLEPGQRIIRPEGFQA